MGTPATWASISLSSEKLTDFTENTAEVLSALSTSADAIVTLLNKIVSLLDFGKDFIGNAVGSILAYLKNLVGDILNTAVFSCVHSNLKYDPDFQVSSWFSNETPPFTANGLPGWLFEVAASSKDETNPFAPLPEDDQPMAGILFTKGVNIDAIDDLSGIVSSCAALTNMVNPNSPLALLAESSKSSVSRQVWKDKLGIEEGRAYFRMAAAEVTKPNRINALSKSIGEGLEKRGSAISDKFGSEAPFPRLTLGQPAWFSAKLSDLLGDPLANIFRTLQKILDQFNTKGTNPITDLLNALSSYLSKIGQLLSELEDYIKLLDDLINTLTQLDFCIIPLDNSEPTGVGGMVSRILTAENVPDYGSEGVVFGMLVGFQGADLSAFQATEGLFSFLGFEFEAALQDYSQEYKDAWTDMTDDIEDAWAATSLVNKAPEWSSPDSFNKKTPQFEFSVVTGNTAIGTITAQSGNTPPSSITYSITGGRDRAHANGSIGVISTAYTEGEEIFQINASGVLSFIEAPDFNNPTASTSGNVYQIEVTADDSVDQTICFIEITVTSS